MHNLKAHLAHYSRHRFIWEKHERQYQSS